MLLFIVAFFIGVRVSVTFHLMCVHIIFSSVSVAELPPFHSVDHIFSLYYFVILVIFRFSFEAWIWVLISSVPGLCLLLTFKIV